MTQIDQKWAQGIRDSVDALISEVERLEEYGGELEKERDSALARLASAEKVVEAARRFDESDGSWRNGILDALAAHDGQGER